MTGKQIAALRKSLGLTQQQFATRLGTHRVTLARWEIGAAKPHRLYLVELIKLNAGKTLENFPTDQELREILAHLTPQELKALRRRISSVFASARRERLKVIPGGRR